MTKGLPRSLAHAKPFAAPINKLSLPVNASIDSVTVAAAIGFGSVLIGDFPEGNILILGVIANIGFAGPTSADLVDTWEGDFGIGTTPASDATITAGDVDLVQSTAVGPATAEAIAETRGEVGTTGVIHDNTDGSLEINLNLLVDAADQTDDTTVAIIATGMVYISYVVLGDD